MVKFLIHYNATFVGELQLKTTTMMTLTFELDKESTDGVQHVSVDDLDTKFVRSRHRYD